MPDGWVVCELASDRRSFLSLLIFDQQFAFGLSAVAGALFDEQLLGCVP